MFRNSLLIWRETAHKNSAIAETSKTTISNSHLLCMFWFIVKGILLCMFCFIVKGILFKSAYFLPCELVFITQSISWINLTHDVCVRNISKLFPSIFSSRVQRSWHRSNPAATNIANRMFHIFPVIPQRYTHMSNKVTKWMGGGHQFYPWNDWQHVQLFGICALLDFVAADVVHYSRHQ